MIRYGQTAALLTAFVISATARAQTPGAPDAGPPPATSPTRESGPVENQPPAESKPATDTKAASAPETTAAPTAQPDAAAQLEEIDQLARIAARKHEILEEEAVKRAKEAPKLSVDDKGFSLRLPDNSFVLRIRGLVQADGRFFVDDDALSANDTFLVRKFRPSIEGTLFSIVDYRLQPEFAGTVHVLDGYSDLHPYNWLRLRLGKYKAPIGLERLQGDADRPFLEQSLVANLSSQRDVGAMIWGDAAEGLFHYAAGVFNGAPDTTNGDGDLNHAKDFQGRLFFQPFKTVEENAFGNLGVGFAAGTGNRKGRLPSATTAAATGLAALRTPGQNTWFSYFAPPTDTSGASTTFTHGRATRLNPQLYYYYKAVGLLTEYIWLKQGVQRGNTIAELTHQAALTTVNFAVGGTVGYDSVTPDHIFNLEKGHWGALELAVRWSWIKLDDATFPTFASPTTSAREAQSFGGAVTWVPRRTVHYTISFEHTRFKGGGGTPASGAAPATITDRAPENVIIARAQVNF